MKKSGFEGNKFLFVYYLGVGCVQGEDAQTALNFYRQ
jgi:hypothetical protein